jgi:tripartite-type tricarboxylate transporter receptor subunit TctC
MDYPARPLTMIVPFAAGGPTDAGGRILGYTIDYGAITTHVLPGALYQLQYDLLNDFEPITPTTTAPYLLYARSTIPAKDLGELISWLKTGRDSRSVGVASAGYRVVTALFQKETGAQLTVVPYRGLGPALQDLIAGHIDLCFGTPDQLSFARAGSVKVYGAASDTRVALVPDTPTFAEVGLPTISFSVWNGIFAPKGTPEEVIYKLNASAVQALADPAIRSRLSQLGFEPFPREKQTPETLGNLVKTDSAKWWPLIKEFGIRAE